ncbi:hypothetical protein ANTQUA_LOCUS6690 [Anthophora quadrimaculata]
MEKNDDAPEDVKRATSVEREIKRGQKDDTFEGYPRLVEKKKRWEHCKEPILKKAKSEKSNGDCCTMRGGRKKKSPKFVMVAVPKESCTFPKLDIIPRHCLTKDDYIKMLATSSRRCPPECEKKMVLRKLKPVSPRIKELAQPTRHRLLITLQEGASILPPALLDNLVRTVEDETCLTPEQAAKISRKRKARGKKKEGRREKWQYKEARKPKKSSTGVTSAGVFDKDAVSCQYLMAERFVRSILQWKCSVPKAELNDVAEVVVKRLADVLEYSPMGNEDRKSQQIRYLAEVISCWVLGVVSEVAESQEEKLLERCRKKEEEIKADIEAEEEDEEDEDEDEDKDRKKYEELDEEFESEEDEKEVADEDAAAEEPPEAVESEEKEAELEEEEVEADVEEVEVTVEMETETQAEPEVQVETEIQTEEKEQVEAEVEATAEVTETEVETTEGTEEKPEDKLLSATEVATLAEGEREAEVEALAEVETDLDALATAELEADAAAKAEGEPGAAVTEAEAEAEAEAKAKAEAEAEAKAAAEAEIVGVPEAEVVAPETEAEIGAGEEIPAKELTEEEVEKVVEVAKEEKVPSKVEARPPREGDVMKDLEDLLKSDLPFLTFDKIIDTIYKMIESSPENTGEDPITNGIHRAIYDKLTNIVILEDPDLLTDELKTVINVVCGKIANWLRSILSKSQLEFMQQYMPEVESKEIRDWTKWLEYISDVAKDWNTWLRSVIEQIFEMESDKITRGEWHDWTKSVDAKALLWRRFHLETMHQADLNAMMLIGRHVVKTGTKGMSMNPDQSEKLIRTADLHT